MTFLARNTGKCNVCGRDLDAFDVHQDFSFYKRELGYGTVHDGQSLRLRMCCNCMDKLIDSCVISPVEGE